MGKIICLSFILCNLNYGKNPFPLWSSLKPKELKEAMFYEKLPNNVVRCKLCPWVCTIMDSIRGICRVRINKGGRLFTLSYSRPCTIHNDPIEKKPFYHFLPGEMALSIATAGCNLGCKFCQNWQISQVAPDEIESYCIPPQKVVSLAKRVNSKIIAYTYSEPIVFYEYMIDTAKLAKKEGIKNVVVTGGFIRPEPLRLLCKHVDAIKVDLKAFNEKYYEKFVGGKLQPVLDAIKIIKQEGTHLEIVYLVVPTLNDSAKEIRKMCRWIKKEVGSEVPLHFSRFYPQYKLKNLPPTPESTLIKLRKIAIEEGLKYVYLGNIRPNIKLDSTYCPRCRRRIIGRIRYNVIENSIVDGACKFCGEKIYGVWK